MKSKWKIVSLSALLLVFNVWFACGEPVSPAGSEPAVLPWNDFTPAQVAGWKPLGTQVDASEKFAPKGGHSMHIRFHRWGGGNGEEQWPRVTAPAAIHSFPADWSGWGALTFDLSVDSSTAVPLSLELRDTPGKNGWTQLFVLQPGTTQHLMVALDRLPSTFDRHHLAEVLFFMTRPAVDADVYLSNIRLVSQPLLEAQQNLEQNAQELAILPETLPVRASLQAQIAGLRQRLTAPDLTRAGAAQITTETLQLQQAVRAQYVKPLQAFDFGPADSPLRAGFTDVTATTAYDAARGYGWAATSGLQQVSQPAAHTNTYSAHYGYMVPPALYLNDLDQDFVGGKTSAEFRVKLPAGDYTVWMLSGLPAPHSPIVNNFTVDAGSGVYPVKLPQNYIFDSRLLPAKVGSDGLLHLRFTPQTGWLINALAIFPSAQKERAAREFVAPIDQEISLLPPELLKQWNLVPHAPEKATSATADETRRGYVLFTRPLTQLIYPDSHPQPDERFRQLDIFAAPGQREVWNFAVQALHPLQQLHLQVSDLKGPSGSRIAAGNITARQIRCWPTRTDYHAGTITYKITPELLDPVTPDDLENGQSRRYWLTVQVPENARPGIYRGTATLLQDNAPPTQVPLQLEVLPLHLQSDPGKDFGNYYYYPEERNSSETDPQALAALHERYLSELRDMQQHGMTTIQMRLHDLDARKVNGKWEAVVSPDLEAHFKTLQSFGLFNNSRGVMMPAFFVEKIYEDLMGEPYAKFMIGAKMPPQEFFDAVTDVIAQIEKVRLAHNWPPFYYYPLDEVSSGSIPILKRTLEAIKKVPTAKTLVTQVFDEDYNRPLDGLVDVWVSGTFTTKQDMMQAQQKKGVLFWCYPNFMACFHGVPNSARMTYGFGMWRMDASCLIPWHYQAPNGNPFNDLDSRVGDWCLTYPGPDGPIDSVRWEMAREGIYDGRYVYTLENALAQAEKRGIKTAAVAQGKALLAEIRAAVPAQASYEQEGPWNGDQYTQYRRRIADAIIALQIK
jgi:hypothetical protein